MLFTRLVFKYFFTYEREVFLSANYMCNIRSKCA